MHFTPNTAPISPGPIILIACALQTQTSHITHARTLSAPYPLNARPLYHRPDGMPHTSRRREGRRWSPSSTLGISGPASPCFWVCPGVPSRVGGAWRAPRGGCRGCGSRACVRFWRLWGCEEVGIPGLFSKALCLLFFLYLSLSHYMFQSTHR